MVRNQDAKIGTDPARQKVALGCFEAWKKKKQKHHQRHYTQALLFHLNDDVQEDLGFKDIIIFGCGNYD